MNFNYELSYLISNFDIEKKIGLYTGIKSWPLSVNRYWAPVRYR